MSDIDTYTQERQWAEANDPRKCLGGECIHCGDRRDYVTVGRHGMLTVTCPTCWHSRQRRGTPAYLDAARASERPAPSQPVQLEMFGGAAW